MEGSMDPCPDAPQNLAVALWLSLDVLTEVPSSTSEAPTKMLDKGLLHVSI